MIESPGADRDGRRRSRPVRPCRSRRRRRRPRGPCRRAAASSPPGISIPASVAPRASPTPIASRDLRVRPVDRDVVEHRQRLGPDADHVVDVHRHAVDPDRVELPQRFGEHQLGPDPVGGERDAEVRRHLDHAGVVAGQRHLRRGPSQLDLPQRPHQPGDRRIGSALVDSGSRVGVAHPARFFQSIWKIGRRLEPMGPACTSLASSPRSARSVRSERAVSWVTRCSAA